MFKGKKVLVTGSEGMIGKELVLQLEELGAEVHLCDIKRGEDLREYEIAKIFCMGIDYVFHLAGIKGSPARTEKSPYDFMMPMIQFDSNMIRASIECDVRRFLYTSSIAVENLETDYYPGWAKLTAENLIKAHRIQDDTTDFCIIRPANVYGRFDNLEAEHCMVISDLVRKAKKGNLVVWGDGSQIRDFINAKDVARGMIKAMRNMPKEPVNLCSGKGETIGYIARLIAEQFGRAISYDKTKPTGEHSRVMQGSYIRPNISIEQGIKEVCNVRGDNRNTSKE